MNGPAGKPPQDKPQRKAPQRKPPQRSFPRPLADFLGPCVGSAFARQGFASADLVTHWAEIVGEEVAAYAEPLTINWPRRAEGMDTEPATLVLRVEGPAAIEVQHLVPVILDRVNRFLGWRAVAKIRLRQAPLMRTVARPQRPAPPAEEDVARIKAGIAGIGDEPLREALARLGAAVKRA